MQNCGKTFLALILNLLCVFYSLTWALERTNHRQGRQKLVKLWEMLSSTSSGFDAVENCPELPLLARCSTSFGDASHKGGIVVEKTIQHFINDTENHRCVHHLLMNILVHRRMLVSINSEKMILLCIWSNLTYYLNAHKNVSDHNEAHTTVNVK